MQREGEIVLVTGKAFNPYRLSSFSQVIYFCFPHCRYFLKVMGTHPKIWWTSLGPHLPSQEAYLYEPQDRELPGA